MGVKYFVDEGFFNVWRPRMAYVLGFLYADGSLDTLKVFHFLYKNVSRELYFERKYKVFEDYFKMRGHVVK